MPRAPRFAEVTRLAGTLWVGSLWTTAFVVPLLFQNLPRAVAGGIASDIFIVVQGAGLLFGGLVAAVVRGRPWRTMAMVAWALDGLFALLILPVMAYLRHTPHFGPQNPTWGLFMGLHLVASAVYLAEALLGAILIGRGF